jgi:Tol biopolymer transport system component
MRRAPIVFVALVSCTAFVLVGSGARAEAPGSNGRIVFGRYDAAADDFRIFAANPDGSDQDQLIPGLAECPTWSPDGTRIEVCAFSSGVLRPVIVDADGSSATPVTVSDPTLNLGCWAWSSQDRLACEGWDEANPNRLPGIFTVSASGADLRRVTANGTGGMDSAGDYSPDGSRIVFLRSSDPDSEVGALFVVDADGTGLRRVTPAIAQDDGSWSPDGRWILFTNVAARVFVVHPDGSGMRRIPLGPNVRAAQPTWSPDGTRILARVHLPGIGLQLMTFAADGTELRAVAGTDGLEEFGDWGVAAS